MEEIKKYPFDTRSYNPYDPHCFVKDHCARVKFQWIHGACHWAEEDPWKYSHNLSKPNELVSIVVEWLAKQREATVAVVAEVNILACNKGKREIFDRAEAEQSYKFSVDPLV